VKKHCVGFAVEYMCEVIRIDWTTQEMVPYWGDGSGFRYRPGDARLV